MRDAPGKMQVDDVFPEAPPVGQRVTDEEVLAVCLRSDSLATLHGVKPSDKEKVYLDLRDSRALAQSQAATIAELRAEVERTREVLAGTDAGSLPNDMPLSRIAEKRMDERYKYFWQVKDTCTRAEAAESALATANAKNEKLEAVAQIAWRLCIHVDLVPYTNSMGVTLSSSVGVYEELKTALAALQEEKPRGD